MSRFGEVRFAIASLVAVLALGAGSDEFSQDRYKEQMVTLIDNNHEVCLTNVQGVTDEEERTRELTTCLESTLADLEVLAAQVSQLHSEHEADCTKLLEAAKDQAMQKFGEAARRGLISSLVASVRNVVNTALIKPAYLGLNIVEDVLGIGSSLRLRPFAAKVNASFKGYARTEQGDPVIVVSKIKSEDGCDATYVVDFRDAIHDLVADQLQQYIMRMGAQARKSKNVHAEKDRIMAKVQAFKADTIEKLSACQGLVVAINSIQENLDKELVSIIKKAVTI